MRTIPFRSFDEILQRLVDAAELRASQGESSTTATSRLDTLIRQMEDEQAHIAALMRKRFRPAFGEAKRQPEWSAAM